MKKLLFLLAFCAILMTGMAQPATSLAIQSAHHEHFWLYLNGTLQNQDAVESIKVSNLAPETYTVRIIIENRDYTEGTLQLQLRAGSNNYEMDYSAREQRLSLNNVDYEIHAAVQMTAAFTQLVQTMFEMQARDEREMHADHRHDAHQGDGHHCDHQPGGQHCDGHHGDHHPSGHHPVSHPVPAPVVVPAPAPVPPAPHVCSPEDFLQIKELVKDEVFEDNKLDIAKQAVRSDLFTTQQLIELAKLFTFEDNKLEFLKFAYDHCFDQNKYYTVNSVFTYSSSKDEMNEFLRDRQR